MSRLWMSALTALVFALSIGACCPTPSIVAPEAPTAPEPGEPGEPGVVAGSIALGGACGPSVGDCDAEGYCAFADDNACGVSGVGVCTARPRGCFKDCPGVCGCDGVRYCNACVAQGRGLSVRHAGACVDGPATQP